MLEELIVGLYESGSEIIYMYLDTNNVGLHAQIFLNLHCNTDRISGSIVYCMGRTFSEYD